MKKLNITYDTFEIENGERVEGETCYTVDARNVAVQRLIDETGHGLDVYEVTDVCEVGRAER